MSTEQQSKKKIRKKKKKEPLLSNPDRLRGASPAHPGAPAAAAPFDRLEHDLAVSPQLLGRVHKARAVRPDAIKHEAAVAPQLRGRELERLGDRRDVPRVAQR